MPWPKALFAKKPFCIEAPSETAGGMILLLRLARKTIFTGMSGSLRPSQENSESCRDLRLQMIADLAVTLMEEGSTLQARMENEILALFSPQAAVARSHEDTRKLGFLLWR